MKKLLKSKGKKLLKSKKALSPVVAAIILIAVTVAVSIAVAAWMGALTFTFMKVEKLEVQGHTWSPTANAVNITIAVKNTGTSPLTLNKVRINSADATKWTTGSWVANNWLSNDYNLDVGEEANVVITRPTGSTFSSGVLYQFEVVTTTNYILPYSKNAP